MAPISARLNEKLRKDIQNFMEEEKLERSTAIRKLLEKALTEWKREKALEWLERGAISFVEAAHMAEMNVWDFARLVADRKTIWIRDMDNIRRDLEAA
ncbi:MAG: UPF0175 family protein [Thermoplasmatota archaeon]